MTVPCGGGEVRSEGVSKSYSHGVGSTQLPEGSQVRQRSQVREVTGICMQKVIKVDLRLSTWLGKVRPVSRGSRGVLSS